MRYVLLIVVLTLLVSGCGGSSLVTRTGEQTTLNDLTYEQFTQFRRGRMFEAVLHDSSRIPMLLVSARSDSIMYQPPDSDEQRSLPTASVSTLIYHQNLSGLNAAVGGFAGCLAMVAFVGSWYNPMSDDGTAVVQAFLCITGGTAAGAAIGYHIAADHEYRFIPKKIRTP